MTAPAYLGGDRFAYADVETRWVSCHNFGHPDPQRSCDYEDWTEVEFLDRVTFQWVCPSCGDLQDDEIGE